VILQIQQQKMNGPMVTTNANPTRRMVLTPAENSDVDYALSFDTKAGGTAATAGLPDGREIIAKTGTTNLSQSAFFIGSIPQFTLAVGMFTNQQGCPQKIQNGCAGSANLESAPPAGVQTLYGLAGLQGYGGQEPASIWHIFAMKEFAPMQVQSFPAPDFGGSAWNLLGPNAPKPKKVHSTPQPSITCQGFFFGKHCKHQGNGGNPTPTPTLPGPQVSATPTPTIRLPGAKR
jgi:membrane peptidoglycan carboxypeptidase